MREERGNRFLGAPLVVHAVLLFVALAYLAETQLGESIASHSFARTSRQGWPAVWRTTSEKARWFDPDWTPSQGGRGLDWTNPEREFRVAPLALALNVALFLDVWLILAILVEIVAKRSFSLARLFALMFLAAVFLGLFSARGRCSLPRVELPGLLHPGILHHDLGVPAFGAASRERISPTGEATHELI
jgi:hypothetical protein